MTLLFAWLSPAAQTEGAMRACAGRPPVIDFRFFRAIMPIFVFALAFIGGIGTRLGGARTRLRRASARLWLRYRIDLGPRCR